MVGITAAADSVSVVSSIIIGFIAGIIVVISVIFIDSKLQLDDPVGALSVHLVCGTWGTLAVGIFSQNPDHSFVTQLIGVISYGLVAFPAAFLIFTVLKCTTGIRVSEEEESMGLDIGEHGMESYAGFQIFTNQ